MTTQPIVELFDLSGKGAIVTGGAIGIGRATALRLAEAGASVMIADIDLEAASQTVQEIQARGGKAQAAKADAGSSADARKVTEETVRAFGRPEDIEMDVASATTYGETEKYARIMLEKGIKPELEVWHTGQYWLVRNLIEQGLVKPPYFIQFVMGFSSGAYASPKELLHLLECAPKPSVFSCLGVGPLQNPMIAMGIVLGINVRTGMEDNVLYKRGKLCSGNGQLVEKVARMARELNREIATPKQARQMLGLSEKPSRYD